jgi:3'(2'), 5'-bisphosphate nucleotidase
VAIEKMIIDRICEIDTDPVIVAEEDERAGLREEVRDNPGRIWVIDPIDGTAEFVNPESREFCSVVCLLEDLIPIAAFVLAPELGRGAAPMLITANVPGGVITINGQGTHRSDVASCVSLTRSKTESPRPYESDLAQLGYSLKTRTTSQTLDMVRTAVDVSGLTDLELPQFGLFARKGQKVWDGLAGLCLGRAAGLISVDEDGNERVPVDVEIMSQRQPVFESTIMGDEELVSWLLERI